MNLPTGIKKIGDSALKLTWPDIGEKALDAWFLRENCQCALCRDERTGERLVPLGSIPKDTKLVKVELVGNYALGLGFSDGHQTGIYSFDHLRRLSA